MALATSAEVEPRRSFAGAKDDTASLVLRSRPGQLSSRPIWHPDPTWPTEDLGRRDAMWPQSSSKLSRIVLAAPACSPPRSSWVKSPLTRLRPFVLAGPNCPSALPQVPRRSFPCRAAPWTFQPWTRITCVREHPRIPNRLNRRRLNRRRPQPTSWLPAGLVKLWLRRLNRHRPPRCPCPLTWCRSSRRARRQAIPIRRGADWSGSGEPTWPAADH